MKITVYAKDLAQAVADCAKAADKKPNTGAAGGILLKADGNTVTLTGYDLQTGIQTKVPAMVQEEGAAVLDAHLSDILKKLPAEQATITTQNHKARIEGGKASYDLVCIKADDYPALPDYALEQDINIPREVLLQIIRQTIFSAGKNPEKPIFTGVKFDITSGQVEANAIDGARLAVRREAIKYDGEDKSVIIPSNTLRIATQLYSKAKDETIKVYMGARYVAFIAEQYTIFSRLLEGNFLDYHKAIPKSFSTSICVEAGEMIESIERTAAIIFDQKMPMMRVSVSESEIGLKATTPLGSATDSVQAEISGEPIEIGLNYSYMIDAIKASEMDRVRFNFSGKFGACTITPLEGDGFLFLLLPMRMKEERGN